MRIDFEQSGGFANVTFRLNVQLEALSPEVVTELLVLVAASGILEGWLAETKSGSIGLVYRLRLSEGPRTASWTGTDGNLPEAFAPLVDRLTELTVQDAKGQR